MKFLNKIFLGSTDKKRLEPTKPFAVSANFKSLRGASLTCVFLLALPLLEIIAFKELNSRFCFYLTFFTIDFIIYVITVLFSKKTPELILPLFYILFISCLIYGGWLGIFAAPAHPGVTFHIVVFVFPLLIADKPWHLDLIIASACITYLNLSSTYKQSAIYHLEFMNVMNSMFLSIFLSTLRQIQNVSDFTDRFILKKQRDTDGLSRTLSRSALEMEIKSVLGEFGIGGCFMFIDIDNFKYINDTYGHVVGDDFIIDTGHCLRSVCRPTDIVGRYGGDEFLIFFPEILDRNFVEKKAQEILNSIQNCGIAKELNENLSVSIGCLIFKTPTDSLTQLFALVDSLLYEAKQNGKNTFRIKEI